jgi:hypothetical protein
MVLSPTFRDEAQSRSTILRFYYITAWVSDTAGALNDNG